jgi:hypothetical protein
MAATEPSTGKVHALEFVDVDGKKLSTADGHITVLVVTNKANSPKANLVGDRVPDFCLGNPAYRMITLVEFDDHSSGVRAFLTSVVRKRLDGEGRKLQARYDANKIARVARNDVYAAVDFNGAAIAKLGDQAGAPFRVFVFGKTGELLKQWDDVPGAEELAAALK